MEASYVDTIIAPDGQALPLLGSVELSLRRDDFVSCLFASFASASGRDANAPPPSGYCGLSGIIQTLANHRADVVSIRKDFLLSQMKGVFVFVYFAAMAW